MQLPKRRIEDPSSGRIAWQRGTADSMPADAELDLAGYFIGAAAMDVRRVVLAEKAVTIYLAETATVDDLVGSWQQ